MLKKRLRFVTSLLGKGSSSEAVNLKNRLKTTGIFDEEWYISTYPEVAKRRKWRSEPIEHFFEKASKGGYWPGVWFNPEWYLQYNEDVKRSGVNPLIHYLYHGKGEGRFRSDICLINPRLPENQFIKVGSEGVNFRIPLIDKTRRLTVSLMYQQYHNVRLNKPCGIVLVTCHDKSGNAIDEGVKGLKWSEVYGCWYRYLTQHSIDELKTDSFSFEPPEAAIFCKVKIAEWDKASLELRNRFRFSSGQRQIGNVSTATPAEIKNADKLLKRADALKVAFIADEFTYNSFKSEFVPIIIEPHNWKQTLEEEKPDIFFCESAWSGVDSVKRPWKGKVYASKNFAKENRLELLGILEYCNKQNIPTVFWNKEDPTHYPDRTHDFVKTACHFDFVFTSAEECVELYKRDYGLKNVFALPFATNPRLFNPIKDSDRSDNVVFAGSWYANHEDRSRVMEEILDPLIESGYKPEIYDRYFGGDDPLHEWPEKYKPYTRPGLPHDQMPRVYKSSLIGLNFNTVTDSSTMFARRVFELMSSNTLVVSNYAKGVDEMFGDLVVFADKEPERLSNLSVEDINALREAALTKVLSEHTYTQRWEYMLKCIGFAFTSSERTVTLSCLIHSQDEALKAISYFEENFARNNSLKLLLVVSANVSDLELSTYYKKFNRFGVSVTCSSYILRHAQEDEFTPFQSDFFVFCDIKNLPDNRWIEHAKLHSSYMDLHPIATTGAKEKYSFTKFSGAGPVLAKSAMFSEVHAGFSTGKEIMVYEV